MSNVLEIFTDGGSRSNPGNAAGAFVVIENGKVLYESKTFFGIKTNNEAEYKAMIEALMWLTENKEKLSGYQVNIKMDSQLVVNQLNGFYKIKNQNLIDLNNIAKEIIGNMKTIKIKYFFIKREFNKLADSLVNKCLDENS